MHGSTSPLEERLGVVLPTAVVADQRYCSADAVVVGIHAELLQLHEAVRGRGPRLTLRPIPRKGLPVPPREQRAALPEAVVALQCEKPRAPPLGGHTRPFGVNDLRGRVA